MHYLKTIFLSAVLLCLSFNAYAESIKVLTYNVWALAVLNPKPGLSIPLSPEIDQRLPKICELFRNGDWDVIFVQEIYRAKDRALLKNCGYDHVVDLENIGWGILPDSGVLILSKYPVRDSHRLTYPENGSKTRIQDGEALASKAGIYGKIEHPTLGPIWVANTHLVSSYRRDGGPSYEKQRKKQFNLYTSKALSLAGGLPLIVAGDMNFSLTESTPDHFDYEKLSSLVTTKYLKNFTRFDSGENCTSCPENVWNTDGGAGMVDQIYGSEHFKAISGGVIFRDTTYKSNKNGGSERHLSDHFGYETEFSF